MAQSLSQVYLHIIFSTKNRQKKIHPEIEAELYKYLAGILKGLDSPAIIVGGYLNHIHILCRLSRMKSISNIMAILKKDSSRWIKTKSEKYRDFYWQNGYGVFSVSMSHVERVKKYIENQKEHHKKMNFKEEYITFLEKYQIEYDERYVWD